MNNATHGASFPLLNDYQRDFPLVSEPFARIGAAQGLAEAEVLAQYRRLQAEGLVSRIGPVFAPRRIGVSTLAALAAPPERLEWVAERVSTHPEVNHNYGREHRYNLWFVATAPDAQRLQAVLGAIESESGCPVIALPLEEEFHIDLGFDLGAAGRQRAAVPGKGGGLVELSAAERTLMAVLQGGLPLEQRPFRTLAERAGMTEEALLATLQGWLERGILKRFGVVVRHHELGFTANAMCVWDVPDARASELGARLAAESDVTLCYRRRRSLPDWPYNLFCMIHGKAREEVLARRQELADRLGLDAWPHDLLFSTRRFKQQGACYARHDELRQVGHG
ncbi:MAG TPA: Lrp/AsnC family transcriptional regulator [Azospira sp.]|nr:Lrp/AsnC family transcriptional regulator [Azospira sp.]